MMASLPFTYPQTEESLTRDKNELLSRLIKAYKKLIRMSHKDGLAAARKFGDDIMLLTDTLKKADTGWMELAVTYAWMDEQVSAAAALVRFCDQINATFEHEYKIEPDDHNEVLEIAYRKNLQAQANMLQQMEATKRADFDSAVRTELVRSIELTQRVLNGEHLNGNFWRP
jgi:hypothetical protein